MKNKLKLNGRMETLVVAHFSLTIIPLMPCLVIKQMLEQAIKID